MNVLVLSPKPELLTETLADCGDEFTVSMEPPPQWPTGMDYIISFGYRHIIKEPYISRYQDRLLNVHLSILPWNRGADPNFWSWFDGTPKGVSIHLIDAGIDTGNLIMQMTVSRWRKNETLRTSYDFLNLCAVRLFALEWPHFRRDDWICLQALQPGTCHKSTDKDQWMAKLPLGYDTPVGDVERLGATHHGH